ncbi:MAG: hypothetical protein AB9869_24040 [Verrucomicrobiia bacterium]
MPPDWAKVEEARSPRCTAKAEQIRILMEALEQDVPEFRRAQGLAYPLAGLICLIVMANAQGVVRGPTDLAIYADTLSRGQLRALKFRRDPHTGEMRCPKKTVFTTVLSEVDDDPPQDQIVIVDGKKVRHAGVEIFNAVDSTGRFLGSVVPHPKPMRSPPRGWFYTSRTWSTKSC